jgi:cation transport regulator ChaC
MTDPSWVFGYGSLIWRPDFRWLDARRAHITGWSRRFWQGSHEHRGLATDPGRVLTLVEAPGERCYGRAFLIEPHLLGHLDQREKNGYERHAVDIGLGDKLVRGVVYIAAPENHAFLGEAPLEKIAEHINRCAGPSGTNVEYVLELAEGLRHLNISDPHVFEVEALVLAMRADQAQGTDATR